MSLHRCTIICLRTCSYIKYHHILLTCPYIIKVTIRLLTCPHTQTLELHYLHDSNYQYLYQKLESSLSSLNL